MAIKTNELQVANSVLGTDSIIADTDVAGTARVPFNTAAEFMKDIFMSGGVPCGKELTESWAALRTRIKAGNMAGIHIGDFKTIQLTTGETVVMEVAGIDQYYRCGGEEIGHHVDFISRDCLTGEKVFNDTDTNQGIAAEPNPWRASKLFQTFNNEATGVYATIPADLRPCIIEKQAMLEARFSEAGALNDSTYEVWSNMRKLWLPTEVEVFGNAAWNDETWGACGGGCNKQYPIFVGGSLHLIKGNGNGGDRRAWWEASARRASATDVCFADNFGAAYFNHATHDFVCAPLCFRIG